MTCANSTASCITVTMSGANAINLFTAAYLGNFNPADLGQNWIADPGASAATRTYSFNVPAGAQTITIVVYDVPPGLATPSGSTYTLNVSGGCIGACAPPNQVPVAKCKNVTVSADANCVANASVDDGSFDPDGDPITITQSPAGPYPKGTTTVLLTVRDPRGATSQCTATVTVVDTTPPVVTSSLSLTQLWPPDHTMKNVGLAASATDNCDSNLTLVVKVYGDENDEEPVGDGNFSPDANNIAVGTLRLRSERKGNGDGRVYLVVVTATDSSGNVGRSARTVTVSLGQGAADLQRVANQAAAAKAYFDANGVPPPGYFVIGDGPVIGPKQ